MWRQDIRDLVSLTETKMGNYLLGNTIQIGFCIALYTEGRFEPGTPEWLLVLNGVSLTASVVFFLLSTWFALHASNAAKAYGVRLLTQFVRYPVPSTEELEQIRTYGQKWEALGTQNVVRIPFLMKGSTDTVDPYGLEGDGEEVDEELYPEIEPAHARHVELFQEAQLFWQSYDAFARVSMAFGTLHLLFATAYYILGYLLIQDAAIWAAWSGVCIFIVLVLALLHLDLALTSQEQLIGCILVALPASVAAVSTYFWALYKDHAQNIARALVPWAYLDHALLLLFGLQVLGVRKSSRGLYLPLRHANSLLFD
jgi:hypothetical protein